MQTQDQVFQCQVLGLHVDEREHNGKAGKQSIDEKGDPGSRQAPEAVAQSNR